MRSESVTDESLLSGLASGDSEASAAFVRRYQSRVFGLAYSMVGDAGSAEEIAQEAFLRVWRHARAYDSRRGRVQTWLLSITRNLAIDHLRVRRGEPVDPDTLDAREMMLMSSARQPDDVHDEVFELRSALRTLPDEQRRPLIMAALGGYTAHEISEIEDTPLGTTKSRIRSAMLKLRDRPEVADE